MMTVSFPLTRWPFHVGILVLAFVMLGCAATTTSVPDDDSLRDRAQAYWDARAVNDLITAFAFEVVSLDADPTLMQRYVARSGAIRYHSADVTTIRRVAEDRAEVDVALVYTIPAQGFRRPMEAEVTTHWIVLRGQWYHQRGGSG